MKRASIAVIALAALAIPAVVIAGGLSTGSTSVDETWVWSNTDPVDTNKKQFKPVPGMDRDTSTTGALAVSADMRGGQAKVRVVDNLGSVAAPGPVTFSSKGSNAFIFFADDAFNGVYIVEWKRAGKDRARASTFAAHVVGNQP